LVLEDDLLLAQTLKEELEDIKYDIDLASSITEASDKTYNNKYDLYLFDVNLPDGNGFELLEQLRQSGDETPTIFLTSKSTAKDVGFGFEIGANDYIKKPFDMEELHYRIKRFLKSDFILNISPDINLNTQTLQLTNKKQIHTMQKREMDILIYFIKNQNKVINKDELVNNIFDGIFFSDATFRVYITNIKKMIGQNFIRNIRGLGYIFEKV